MATKPEGTQATRETEAELARFFARYEPAIMKLGQALRAKLRQRLAGLFEIVYLYERQGSLVLTYSPTERGFEGLCSLALEADGVKLHFGRGAELAKADPGKLLQGRGKTVRHVELRSVADYERPEIEALLVAALQLGNVRPEAGAKGATILKAEEQKQRAARRPTAARTTAARTTAARGAKKAKKARS
ncbi:MAG: hypothetical protein IPN34_19200 [Planctomycetes bacterium]|nr:hypothetical protein [Planctomycetota bacterium]